MGIVQTYLGKWGDMWILVMSLLKFWEKNFVREEKDMMCQREKKNWIVAIPLPKLWERKNLQLWQFNCRNMKGTAKRGTWNFSRNLENFGAHKERELVEGGDKIW